MTEQSDEFLVFLDRDGTIIEDRHYLADPDGVELLDGAAEGLRNIISLGGRLVVVTNQSGIGRGLFDRSAADAVNDRLRDVLNKEGIQLAGIYLCPHTPTDSCECRKPRSLLFETASHDLGLPLGDCYIIGDRSSDIEAGHRIKASTILIAPSESHVQSTDISWVATDLAHAAEFIIRTRFA